jgi:Ser/Thr protein kinase RdoA (MazF antagonist)
MAHDFARTAINRDWVIQELMPGLSLSAVEQDLPKQQLTHVWHQVGSLTARLHAHQGVWFGPPVKGDTFARWSDLATHDLDGFIDDAGRFGLDSSPFYRLRDLVDRLRPALDEGVRPCLIHSDLSPEHVFVVAGPDGWPRVSGIIDLEFGRYADPLSESLFAWFAQVRGSRSPFQAFLGGYGWSGLTAPQQRRVRFVTALSLGWWATLLAYQGRPVSGVMDEFCRAVESVTSN